MQGRGRVGAGWPGRAGRQRVAHGCQPAAARGPVVVRRLQLGGRSCGGGSSGRAGAYARCEFGACTHACPKVPRQGRAAVGTAAGREPGVGGQRRALEFLGPATEGGSVGGLLGPRGMETGGVWNGGGTSGRPLCGGPLPAGRVHSREGRAPQPRGALVARPHSFVVVWLGRCEPAAGGWDVSQPGRLPSAHV